MSGEKLVSLMRLMANEGIDSSSTTDLVFGEVMSVSPLEVRIDSRLNIKEQFILLSSLCKRKAITITEGEIELWRGLQIGDNLSMLRVLKGQLYYAIERTGDL